MEEFEEPMVLATGTRLGPYEIVSPIGAGGMGEVYRARDTRLERTVAVKILPQHLSSSAEARERFDREARAISSLSHPHICPLYDVGHQDDVDYLVMECLEGQTLAQRLQKGPLPVSQALEYAAQIADALEAAHRQGVIHRDLKPGNVMLTKSGTRLLDFGLAKLRGAAAEPGLSAIATQTTPLTTEGTVVGTLQYMAPEQLEGKDAEARTDIFALGAVIYEMITGEKAFKGKSHASLISAIMSSEPVPIARPEVTMPAGLEHVVRACLAKEPDERWQSAHDVKLELRWLAGRGADAEAQAAVSKKAGLQQKLAWGAAALMFVVAAAGAWIGFHHPVPPALTVRSSLAPPPNWSFVPYNFALSPDATRLAFVAVNPDGATLLWIRVLSAASAQQINGTEGALYPFWSPDSQHVGLFTDAGKLKTADVAGGGVRILCDAPVGRGGTWNKDDTIVFAPSLAGPLFRVSAAGGTPVPVTQIGPQGSGLAHRWPSFLPDGKHFLYFVDWSAPGDVLGPGIYAGSLDTSESKPVSQDLGNVMFASGNLLYVRDRALMAQPFDPERLRMTGPSIPITEQEIERDAGFAQTSFSASQTGTLVFQSAADVASHLTWFDRSGKEVGQLPEPGYKDPQLSPDGRALAIDSDDTHNGKHYIRVYDLARGVTTRLTDGGAEEFPLWSHDGKTITYVTTDGRIYSICQIPADASGPPQVLFKGTKMIPNSLSPDGKYLAMMTFPRGGAHLAVFSMADHSVKEFADGAEAQFSPDGRWVSYLGSGGTATGGGIMVQPFPGPGARIQISKARGTQARWSRDGKTIFYMQADKKLMVVRFDPQKGEASAPEVVFQTRIVATRYAYFQYDVAADGRILINSLPSNYSSPLTLITGWNWVAGAQRTYRGLE